MAKAAVPRIRRFLELGVSKTAIAKLTGRKDGDQAPRRNICMTARMAAVG